MLNVIVVGKQQFVIGRYEARPASHVARLPAA